MKNFKILQYALAFVYFLFIQPSGAMELYVKASVTAPTCTINNDNVIEVDFGRELLIKRIDGQNYRKNVPYSIVCDANVPATIKLQIEGNAASFNSDLLRSDQPGLGFSFYLNGNTMPINQKIDASYLNQPQLDVVPVKDPNQSLIAGDFNATATLAVYYQ